MKDEGKEENIKPDLSYKLSKKINLITSSCRQLDAKIGPFELELRDTIDKREKESKEAFRWRVHACPDLCKV